MTLRDNAKTSGDTEQESKVGSPSLKRRFHAPKAVSTTR
jgi:hypothetical protein